MPVSLHSNMSIGTLMMSTAAGSRLAFLGASGQLALGTAAERKPLHALSMSVAWQQLFSAQHVMAGWSA